MSYFSVVTNIGKSKIANALQSGTAVNIAKLYVSETELTPDEEMTEPIDKIWDSNLQKYSVDGNIISASSVIPADVGTFTVRSMGLIDSDGDLFAIANVPATLKSNENNVASILELTISIKLENTNVVNFDIISDFDTVIDEKSSNAVQNKAIAAEIKNIKNTMASIGIVYDPEYHAIELGEGGHSGGGGGGSGYTLTAATEDRLGGIKIGDGLSAEQDGTTAVNSIPLSEIQRLINKNGGDSNG